MKNQKGFALLVLVSGLLIAATALFAIKMLESMEAKAERTNETAVRLEAIRVALVQFGAAHGRLPCPADGTVLTVNPVSDTGLASPNAAANNCTNQANGIVPWASLGIPRDLSIDAWGRKFSYRVFEGANGLTRATGLHCDSTMPNGSGYPDCAALPVPLTVILAVAPNNTDTAFVLISHGPTGNGARLAQGGQLTPLPAVGNTAERNNLSAAGPFYDTQKSDPSVLDTDVGHFDDMVLYMTRDSLAAATTRKRNWP